MTPKLFSMMFSAMLVDVFRTVMLVFLSGYLLDGKLFNIRRLQAKSKVLTEVLDKLLYGMAENVKTETKMLGAMDRVSQSCDNYDLTIST